MTWHNIYSKIQTYVHSLQGSSSSQLLLRHYFYHDLLTSFCSFQLYIFQTWLKPIYMFFNFPYMILSIGLVFFKTVKNIFLHLYCTTFLFTSSYVLIKSILVLTFIAHILLKIFTPCFSSTLWNLIRRLILLRFLSPLFQNEETSAQLRPCKEGHQRDN